MQCTNHLYCVVESEEDGQEVRQGTGLQNNTPDTEIVTVACWVGASGLPRGLRINFAGLPDCRETQDRSSQFNKSFEGERTQSFSAIVGCDDEGLES